MRPALIAGLALVIMETLSDFGAVEHFAVQTFTTGIFRTWFGMYDLNTAMQLSSILMISLYSSFSLKDMREIECLSLMLDQHLKKQAKKN